MALMAWSSETRDIPQLPTSRWFYFLCLLTQNENYAMICAMICVTFFVKTSYLEQLKIIY